MTDYETAIDDIFGAFKTAWDADTTAIVGYVPEVRWPGVEEKEKPDTSKHWARVSQQTVLEGQASLRNDAGQRRYTCDGLVFVQIFCPKSDNLGMTNGRKLAKIARNAFRGKATANGVWFRNARINELPSEQNFYRFNVVAEYEYDELG